MWQSDWEWVTQWASREADNANINLQQHDHWNNEEYPLHNIFTSCYPAWEKSLNACVCRWLLKERREEWRPERREGKRDDQTEFSSLRRVHYCDVNYYNCSKMYHITLGKQTAYSRQQHMANCNCLFSNALICALATMMARCFQGYNIDDLWTTKQLWTRINALGLDERNDKMTQSF